MHRRTLPLPKKKTCNTQRFGRTRNIKVYYKIGISMNRNKAAEQNGIVIEMLSASENFGIDNITKMINKVNDSGHIPEDFCGSIFIALPGAN